MKTRISTACPAALALLTAITLVLADQPSKPSIQGDSAPGVPVTAPARAEPAAPTALSLWTAELVKMAKSGVEPDVMLTFITSAGTFNLGAEQIIYLRDLGVPSEVITAIIRHDVDVRASGQDTPPPIRISAPSLPLATQKQAPRAKVAPSTPDSIVAPPPVTAEESIIAPDSEMAMGEEADFDPFGFPLRLDPPENSNLSPVREPYPVKLNDPILMYRAAGPSPNTVVIRRFH